METEDQFSFAGIEIQRWFIETFLLSSWLDFR